MSKPRFRHYRHWKCLAERLGLELLAVELRGKHPKLRLRYRDVEFHQVVSATPSDHRAERNKLSQLRQQIARIDARRAAL